MSSVTVVGLQELGAKLDKLFKEDAKKAVRTAIKPSIEVIRKEIRAKAPVRVEVGATGFRKTSKGKKEREPGYLKAHIGRWIKPSGDGSLSAFVGPTRSAFYGRFYELGTSHQPPRPFIGPAFESKKNEAETIFGKVLYEEILKGLK